MLITRRTFFKNGLAFAAGSALGPSQLKPADDIAVDPSALIEFAQVRLKTHGVTGAEQQFRFSNGLGHQLYEWADQFNTNLPNRGYVKRNVNVGAIFISEDGTSFRVGNQGVIAVAHDKINEGRDPTKLEEAHEFGHLYHRHGANVLFEFHPQIYSGHDPDVLRLQKKYAHLFDQVDVRYELAHYPKENVDVYTADKLAEEMAVRQTGLADLSIRISQNRLETAHVFERGPNYAAMSAEKKSLFQNARHGIEGQLAGAHAAQHTIARKNTAALSRPPL